MEKREKILNILRICAHAVPTALIAMAVLTLIIGAFTYGGTWDKISAAFVYPYMLLGIVGGVLGAALDIRKIIKKEGILKNILLILLSVFHILFAVWLLLLHEAFSV